MVGGCAVVGARPAGGASGGALRRKALAPSQSQKRSASQWRGAAQALHAPFDCPGPRGSMELIEAAAAAGSGTDCC